MRQVAFLLAIWALFLGGGSLSAADSVKIRTIFGYEYNVAPLVLDLLGNKAMQRLKDTDTVGLSSYYSERIPLKQYDHALGVYILLRRYGAPLKECVAGLLRHASEGTLHGMNDNAFLEYHLLNMVPDSSDEGNSSGEISIRGNEEIRQAIQIGYLQKYGIGDILANYSMNIKDFWSEKEDFPRLQSAPLQLSIDAIEYHLHMAYLQELIHTDEIEQLLSCLYFHAEQKRWVFSDIQVARRFGKLSLHLTEHVWAEPATLMGNYWGEQAIQRALDSNILTHEDLCCGGDRLILNKLDRNNSSVVRALMERLRKPQGFSQRIRSEDEGVHLFGSFRGIDPLVWVQWSGEWQAIRLTELDPDYAQEFARVRAFVEEGVHIAPANMNFLLQRQLPQHVRRYS